jgi:hypothetical protein
MVYLGRAIAMTVIRRPPPAEDRIRARISPFGICGGHFGTGTGFFSEFFGFPVSIIPSGLHTHIYHLGEEQ